MNGISHTELHESLRKLVPDVEFACWLCFSKKQNVWATRQILNSRVTTSVTTNVEHDLSYGYLKAWGVDNKLTLEREWHLKGTIRGEHWHSGKQNGVLWREWKFTG